MKNAEYKINDLRAQGYTDNDIKQALLDVDFRDYQQISKETAEEIYNRLQEEK